MALSEDNIATYQKRLLLCRTKILLENGFYGLLLMHLTLAIDPACDTAATDGKRIWFGPRFLEDLSDRELEFVMLHELLHVVLQHCQRGRERDPVLFNIACDIVVNSNILLANNLNPKSITLRKYGESMHLTPKRDEGYLYTAEEVYEMFPPKRLHPTHIIQKIVDDHSRWNQDKDTFLQDVWLQRISDAAAIVGIDGVPDFAQRMLKEIREPQLDWRSVLADFVQEEICDYSFSPPDRRFLDSPFFLPDFHETEEVVSDILFMVDTSQSMSDEMVAAAFSEIVGAMMQFNGKLRGWLGFFDVEVTEPVPFETVDEIHKIPPIGGGGTCFESIFGYVRESMSDKPPTGIIILTDGYAHFPSQSEAGGIPVLWLLNNEEVDPPWGKVARIKL